MKIGAVEVGDFPVMLAPMEDISDPPFRKICKKLGADVVFTEFIASEGLIRDAQKSRKKLEFSEEERPLGIQIFGNKVEAMVMAARLAEEMNPDFIDLNFGCPVRKIVNKGGGAALLQDIPLLLEITEAVVKSVKKPVTVKTRLGWDEKSKLIVQLAEQLQDIGISALTIHGRTRAQLYAGKADWTLIAEVKNNPRMYIPIIGNGDVIDGPSAAEKRAQTGVDGIMIGRAATGNPWIFREVKHFLKTGEQMQGPDLSERIDVCRSHLLTSVEWKGEMVGLLETRRHYASYFKGIADFKQYRLKLVTAQTIEEILSIFEEIRTKCINI
ncbi:MAG: tRNA dihydrouridine synthase DusB [Bacteroidetes bacterium HGW-Bacteroidetes-9]|jgi:nifR3 family TIM-barrel protein|nr:MAG: tRNA dihydrouridine synthase DusB [Bacteroidetes bacterium HGW-Bacteroidetes-9]